MRQLNDIIQDLTNRWNEPAVSLCLQIIDHMAKVPDDELRMLTYNSIAKLLNKPAIDNDVQVAMTILVSSSIHILELKFMYISDDEEFEVEEENLIITKTEKTLIHPITGDAVPDFEGHVFPFFVPSEQFFSIKRNS